MTLHSGNSAVEFRPRGSLRDVISTDQIAQRPSRPPDHVAENRVLLELGEAMASSPETVLQKLVDEARSLCRADSAGISLLPGDGTEGGLTEFRWVATTGTLGPFVGNTMPRGFSPCGSVLDENRMLLMIEPERYFEYISGLKIPICEVLLVPFHRNGVAIGTVWLVHHTKDRRFDAEDARLATSLSRFAAAATQVQAIYRAERAAQLQALRAAEGQVAQLEASNEEMGRTERQRSDFLATLSHELRNTLAPLMNGLRLIRLSRDPAILLRATDMMDRQVKQLVRLVDDLMETSRLASNKLMLDCEPLDLVTVVIDAIESVRPKVEDRRQQVLFDVPAQPLLINGDAVRLLQVLGNLLSNASKYGDAGGVIIVTAQQDGEYARVAVKDSGMGIDAASLPHVFETFYQVDRSLTKSDGGLGLGLALVKGLTERHDGRVEVESEGLGKGSRFTVRLPLLKPTDI